MKTDEEISELFWRWGRWLRKEPGISLGVRLQQISQGSPPKRFVRTPPFVDEECETVDKLIAAFCSPIVIKCLLVKYVGQKSNPIGASILDLPAGTYKAYIREAKFRVQTALDYREKNLNECLNRIAG